MNTPDLSQDRELVELADAMYAAIGQDFDRTILVHRNKALAMADAARTFLGSGYRLPAATEANAERLAKMRYEAETGMEWDEAVGRGAWVTIAREHLRALHSAFGEPQEKPEPCNEKTPDCPSCGRELRAIDATAGVCWRCRRGEPYPPKPPLPAERTADEVAEALRAEEVSELRTRFMLALAGNEGWMRCHCEDWPTWAIRTRKMAEEFCEATCK